MLWLLLAACTTVRFPPDLWDGDFLDTGLDRNVFVGETLPECGVESSGWSFTVWTVGTAGSVSVDMIDVASSTGEQHPLDLIGSLELGTSDQFRVDLSAADNAFIAGRSSTFGCGDASRLGFVARVYSRFGVLTDCLAFGDRAAEASTYLRANDPEIDAFGGCPNFE